MDLLSPESVKLRLQAAGIWSKKRLGQHFLVNQSVLEKIIEAAKVNDQDTVVEIGPGLGVLSRELLTRAGKVIAFEFDPDMVDFLANDLPELTVIAGDVLQTAPAIITDLASYKIVANIPYQITTPLIRLFLEGEYQPESITLLVQKEVGKRLAADAKESDRGYLSVLCQYFASVEYVATVPASSFWPIPKVDSGIIHLKVRSKRLFPASEERDFLRFVRTLFINPRKQLKNVVAGIRGSSAAEIEKQFTELGLPLNVRAQELSVEQWAQLYKEAL